VRSSPELCCKRRTKRRPREIAYLDCLHARRGVAVATESRYKANEVSFAPTTSNHYQQKPPGPNSWPGAGGAKNVIAYACSCRRTNAPIRNKPAPNSSSVRGSGAAPISPVTALNGLVEPPEINVSSRVRENGPLTGAV